MSFNNDGLVFNFIHLFHVISKRKDASVKNFDRTRKKKINVQLKISNAIINKP